MYRGLISTRWLLTVTFNSFILYGSLGTLTAADRPNVILVMTDDQGYGDFSCHGNPVVKTPNLDQLSTQSIRFTDFHVAPMCTPTRGQLMSGLDALRNGAMNVSSGRVFLRSRYPTMANFFANSGYRCGQFGKWHLGDNYPYRPHDRGFHECLYYPSSHIGSAPDYFFNHYFNDTYVHNGTRQKYTGYTTDVLFDAAIEWMKGESRSNNSFFCYLATAAAHGPLYVPEEDRKAYENLEIPGVPANPKNAVARFFGMISNIDRNMGKLEAFLQASGLRDNTLLLFLTDNGGTAGVPVHNAEMKGSKISLWEGGHRVPLFVRWPKGGLRNPCDITELTHVQDVLPTLVELCQLNRPNDPRFDGARIDGPRFDGVSLHELLRGTRSNLDDRMLVINYSRMMSPRPTKEGAAVLWKRWRLLEDRELYDLTTDPRQERNVISNHPEIAARMRAHLTEWWQDVEPRLDEFGAIVIGNDGENPAQLSPADWQDSFLDQGAQVRAGLQRNGDWNLVVEQAADYEFELRRWPREAAASITARIPVSKHTDGSFTEGKSMPIASARCQIGELDQQKSILSGAESVTFATRLAAGRTKLRTAFLDSSGNELCGAYYVYVTRK